MNLWIQQIFDSSSARTGGIVRRSVADVERLASRRELIAAVLARGFHLIRVGNQYVIICTNSGDVEIIH